MNAKLREFRRRLERHTGHLSKQLNEPIEIIYEDKGTRHYKLSVKYRGKSKRIPYALNKCAVETSENTFKQIRNFVLKESVG